MALLPTGQSGGYIRRPVTGPSHSVLVMSRVPVRGEGDYGLVLLFLPPEASPVPCASGTRVRAKGERVHLVTYSDVHIYSCSVPDTEYAPLGPTYDSTNEVALPFTTVRLPHTVVSVLPPPLSSVAVPVPGVMEPVYR